MINENQLKFENIVWTFNMRQLAVMVAKALEFKEPVLLNEDTTRLFEWVDGPLLHAMTNGNVFLADEISLADDSVLERLNSLL
ncbi:hypothetical protein NQ317_006307, partial [Molorchus minor]